MLLKVTFFAYERSEKRKKNEIFNYSCSLKLKSVFHTTKQQLFPETVSSLAGERERRHKLTNNIE